MRKLQCVPSTPKERNLKVNDSNVRRLVIRPGIVVLLVAINVERKGISPLIVEPNKRTMQGNTRRRKTRKEKMKERKRRRPFIYSMWKWRNEREG